jgi:putative peptide zinc metalloprotease protein
VTTLVDAPARVDGVQLIGEMVGSGYRTPPSLVRRSDGQVLQLTPLLYLVLAAADGRRSCAEIAERIGDVLGRSMTEDQVRTLVDGQLRPLGLLRRADGTDPELRRPDPLLRLKPRFAVTSPRATRLMTDPFRILFAPVVVAAVLLAFAVVVGWVFFERGLAASAYDAFERPHLLLLVFVMTVLSGGFHEFGHAAAARYGGAQPGAMGMGLYLVWPAFYTDVTDSYRLDRAGRIRTDLGGLYFNALVAVLTFAWWWLSGWEALLLLVATQVLQMMQQLLPLLRFDGYHVLADIAGVPDLYHRIRPTLVGMLPHRWRDPEQQVLTPRARVLISAWVLVTIPMMALMLLGVVGAVPRLLGSAHAVVKEDVLAGASAWGEGNAIDVAGHALQVLGVLLPALAAVLVVSRVGTRSFSGLARWSQDSSRRRLVATLVSTAVVTALFWAWWPHPGAYRPIQPGERGLVTSLLPGAEAGPAGGLARPAALAAPPPGAAAEQRLADQDEPLVAVFDEKDPLPTQQKPSLALVLVPTGPAASVGSTTAPPAPVPSTAPVAGEPPAAEPWVFPFDQPLPPAEGDNQALAVNTTDGSVVYDVAFALVWADGDEVLNVNEAHAYASCTDCVAVAVAFQVVLIMDDAQVVVPQNLAVAANYECYRCITAALANQLVLSLDGAPDEGQLQALSEVWSQLLELAATITSHSLADVSAQLEDIKGQIVTILTGQPPAPDGSAAPSPPAPTGTSTTQPSGTPIPSPGTTTTPGGTSGTPSTSPSTTTVPSPAETTPTPSSEPSPTGSTSPEPTTTATPTPTPTPTPS